MPVVAKAAAVEERRAREQQEIVAVCIVQRRLVLAGEIDDLIPKRLPPQTDAKGRMLRRQRIPLDPTIADEPCVHRHGPAIANCLPTETHVGLELRVTAVIVSRL